MEGSNQVTNGETLKVVESNASGVVQNCTLCGCSTPAVKCDKCGSQVFCLSCDDMYHRHPKRRFHLRKAVDSIWNTHRSPRLRRRTELPGDPSKIPIPPPRSKKRHATLGAFSLPFDMQMFGYKNPWAQKRGMEPQRDIRNRSPLSMETNVEKASMENEPNGTGTEVDQLQAQRRNSADNPNSVSDSSSPIHVMVPGASPIQMRTVEGVGHGYPQQMAGHGMHHSMSATDLSGVSSAQPVPPFYQFPHVHGFMHPHMPPYHPSMGHYGCTQCQSSSWSNLMSPTMAHFHQHPQQWPTTPSPLSKSSLSPENEAMARQNQSPTSGPMHFPGYMIPPGAYAYNTGTLSPQAFTPEPSMPSAIQKQNPGPSALHPEANKPVVQAEESQSPFPRKPSTSGVANPGGSANGEEAEGVEGGEEEEVVGEEEDNTEFVIPEKPTTPWECLHCTYVNPPGSHICEICCKTSYQVPKKKKKLSKKKEQASPAVAESPVKIVDDVVPMDIHEEAYVDHSQDNKNIAKVDEAISEAATVEHSDPQTLEASSSPIAEEKETLMEDETSADAQTVTTDTQAATADIQTVTADTQTVTADMQTVSADTQTGMLTSDAQIQVTEEATSIPDAEIHVAKREMCIQTELADAAHKRSIATDPMISSQSMESLLSGVSAPPYHNRRAGNSFSTQSLSAFERGRSRSPMPRSSSAMGDIRSLGRGIPILFQDPMGPSWTHSWLSSDPMYYKPHALAPSPSRDDYYDGNWGSMDRLNRGAKKTEEEKWKQLPGKPRYHKSLENLKIERVPEPPFVQCLKKVKDAERCGYSVEDLTVAYFNCRNDDPVFWLQENWDSLVKNVISLAAKCAEDNEEHDVGAITPAEAKYSLHKYRGNIWEAVGECIELRQRKILELTVRGNFTQKQIVEALKNNDGNVELAYADLIRATSKLFKHILSPGLSEESEDISIHVAPPKEVADGGKSRTIQKQESSEDEDFVPDKKRSEFLNKLTAVREAQSERRKAREEKELCRDTDKTKEEEEEIEEPPTSNIPIDAIVESIAEQLTEDVLKEGLLESDELQPSAALEDSRFEVIPDDIQPETVEEYISDNPVVSPKKEEELPEDFDGHWVDSQGEWIEEFSDEQWDEEGEGEWVTVRTRYKKMDEELDAEALEMAALWGKEELADDVFEDEPMQQKLTPEKDLELKDALQSDSGGQWVGMDLAPTDIPLQAYPQSQEFAEEEFEMDANDNWILKDTEKLLQSPQNEMVTNEDEKDTTCITADVSEPIINEDSMTMKLSNVSREMIIDREGKGLCDSLEGSIGDEWEKVEKHKSLDSLTEELRKSEEPMSKPETSALDKQADINQNDIVDAEARQSPEIVPLPPKRRSSSRDNGVSIEPQKATFVDFKPIQPEKVTEGPVPPVRRKSKLSDSEVKQVVEQYVTQDTEQVTKKPPEKLNNPHCFEICSRTESPQASADESQRMKYLLKETSPGTSPSEESDYNCFADSESEGEIKARKLKKHYHRSEMEKKDLGQFENPREMEIDQENVIDEEMEKLKLELEMKSSFAKKSLHMLDDEEPMYRPFAGPLVRMRSQESTSSVEEGLSSKAFRGEASRPLQLFKEPQQVSCPEDNVVIDESMFHSACDVLAFEGAQSSDMQDSIEYKSPSYVPENLEQYVSENLEQYGPMAESEKPTDELLPGSQIPIESTVQVSMAATAEEVLPLSQPTPFQMEDTFNEPAAELEYHESLEELPTLTEMEATSAVADYFFGRYNEIVPAKKPKKKPILIKGPAPLVKPMSASVVVKKGVTPSTTEVSSTKVVGGNKDLGSLSKSTFETGAGEIIQPTSAPQQQSTPVSQQQGIPVSQQQGSPLLQQKDPSIIQQPPAISSAAPVEKKTPEQAESLSFAEDYFFGSYNEVTVQKKPKKKPIPFLPRDLGVEFTPIQTASPTKKTLVRSSSSENVATSTSFSTDSVSKSTRVEQVPSSQENLEVEEKSLETSDVNAASVNSKTPEAIIHQANIEDVIAPVETTETMIQDTSQVVTVPRTTAIPPQQVEPASKSKSVTFGQTSEIIAPPPRGKKIKKEESQPAMYISGASNAQPQPQGPPMSAADEYLYGRYDEIMTQQKKGAPLSKKKLPCSIEDLENYSSCVPCDSDLPITSIKPLSEIARDSLLSSGTDLLQTLEIQLLAVDGGVRVESKPSQENLEAIEEKGVTKEIKLDVETSVMIPGSESVATSNFLLPSISSNVSESIELQQEVGETVTPHVAPTSDSVQRPVIDDNGNTEEPETAGQLYMYSHAQDNVDESHLHSEEILLENNNNSNIRTERADDEVATDKSPEMGIEDELGLKSTLSIEEMKADLSKEIDEVKLNIVTDTATNLQQNVDMKSKGALSQDISNESQLTDIIPDVEKGLSLNAPEVELESDMSYNMQKDSDEMTDNFKTISQDTKPASESDTASEKLDITDLSGENQITISSQFEVDSTEVAELDELQFDLGACTPGDSGEDIDEMAEQLEADLEDMKLVLEKAIDEAEEISEFGYMKSQEDVWNENDDDFQEEYSDDNVDLNKNDYKIEDDVIVEEEAENLNIEEEKLEPFPPFSCIEGNLEDLSDGNKETISTTLTESSCITDVNKLAQSPSDSLEKDASSEEIKLEMSEETKAEASAEETKIEVSAEETKMKVFTDKSKTDSSVEDMKLEMATEELKIETKTFSEDMKLAISAEEIKEETSDKELLSQQLDENGNQAGTSDIKHDEGKEQVSQQKPVIEPVISSQPISEMDQGVTEIEENDSRDMLSDDFDYGAAEMARDIELTEDEEEEESSECTTIFIKSSRIAPSDAAASDVEGSVLEDEQSSLKTDEHGAAPEFSSTDENVPLAPSDKVIDQMEKVISSESQLVDHTSMHSGEDQYSLESEHMQIKTIRETVPEKSETPSVASSDVDEQRSIIMSMEIPEAAVQESTEPNEEIPYDDSYSYSSIISRFYEEFIESAHPSSPTLVETKPLSEYSSTYVEFEDSYNETSDKPSKSSLQVSECSNDSFDSIENIEITDHGHIDIPALSTSIKTVKDNDLMPVSKATEESIEISDQSILLSSDTIPETYDDQAQVCLTKSDQQIILQEIPLTETVNVNEKLKQEVNIVQQRIMVTESSELLSKSSLARKRSVITVDQSCQTELDIYEEDQFYDTLDDDLLQELNQNNIDSKSILVETGIQCQIINQFGVHRMSIDSISIKNGKDNSQLKAYISDSIPPSEASGFREKKRVSSATESDFDSFAKQDSEEKSLQESNSFESLADDDSDIFIEMANSESDDSNVPIKRHLRLIDIDSGTGSISGSDTEGFLDIDTGYSQTMEKDNNRGTQKKITLSSGTSGAKYNISEKLEKEVLLTGKEVSPTDNIESHSFESSVENLASAASFEYVKEETFDISKSVQHLQQKADESEVECKQENLNGGDENESFQSLDVSEADEMSISESIMDSSDQNQVKTEAVIEQKSVKTEAVIEQKSVKTEAVIEQKSVKTLSSGSDNAKHISEKLEKEVLLTGEASSVTGNIMESHSFESSVESLTSVAPSEYVEMGTLKKSKSAHLQQETDKSEIECEQENLNIRVEDKSFQSFNVSEANEMSINENIMDSSHQKQVKTEVVMKQKTVKGKEEFETISGTHVADRKDTEDASKCISPIIVKKQASSTSELSADILKGKSLTFSEADIIELSKPKCFTYVTQLSPPQPILRTPSVLDVKFIEIQHPVLEEMGEKTSSLSKTEVRASSPTVEYFLPSSPEPSSASEDSSAFKDAASKHLSSFSYTPSATPDICPDVFAQMDLASSQSEEFWEEANSSVHETGENFTDVSSFSTDKSSLSTPLDSEQCSTASGSIDDFELPGLDSSTAFDASFQFQECAIQIEGQTDIPVTWDPSKLLKLSGFTSESAEELHSDTLWATAVISEVEGDHSVTHVKQDIPKSEAAIPQRVEGEESNSASYVKKSEDIDTSLVSSQSKMHEKKQIESSTMCELSKFDEDASISELADVSYHSTVDISEKSSGHSDNESEEFLSSADENITRRHSLLKTKAPSDIVRYLYYDDEFDESEKSEFFGDGSHSTFPEKTDIPCEIAVSAEGMQPQPSSIEQCQSVTDIISSAEVTDISQIVHGVITATVSQDEKVMDIKSIELQKQKQVVEQASLKSVGSAILHDESEVSGQFVSCIEPVPLSDVLHVIKSSSAVKESTSVIQASEGLECRLVQKESEHGGVKTLPPNSISESRSVEECKITHAHTDDITECMKGSSKEETNIKDNIITELNESTAEINEFNDVPSHLLTVDDSEEFKDMETDRSIEDIVDEYNQDEEDSLAILDFEEINVLNDECVSTKIAEFGVESDSRKDLHKDMKEDSEMKPHDSTPSIEDDFTDIDSYMPSEMSMGESMQCSDNSVDALKLLDIETSKSVQKDGSSFQKTSKEEEKIPTILSAVPTLTEGSVSPPSESVSTKIVECGMESELQKDLHKDMKEDSGAKPHDFTPSIEGEFSDGDSYMPSKMSIGEGMECSVNFVTDDTLKLPDIETSKSVQKDGNSFEEISKEEEKLSTILSGTPTFTEDSVPPSFQYQDTNSNLKSYEIPSEHQAIPQFPAEQSDQLKHEADVSVEDEFADVDSYIASEISLSEDLDHSEHSITCDMNTLPGVHGVSEEQSAEQEDAIPEQISLELHEFMPTPFSASYLQRDSETVIKGHALYSEIQTVTSHTSSIRQLEEEESCEHDLSHNDEFIDIDSYVASEMSMSEELEQSNSLVSELVDLLPSAEHISDISNVCKTDITDKENKQDKSSLPAMVEKKGDLPLVTQKDIKTTDIISLSSKDSNCPQPISQDKQVESTKEDISAIEEFSEVDSSIASQMLVSREIEPSDVSHAVITHLTSSKGEFTSIENEIVDFKFEPDSQVAQSFSIAESQPASFKHSLESIPKDSEETRKSDVASSAAGVADTNIKSFGTYKEDNTIVDFKGHLQREESDFTDASCHSVTDELLSANSSICDDVHVEKTHISSISRAKEILEPYKETDKFKEVPQVTGSKDISTKEKEIHESKDIKTSDFEKKMDKVSLVFSDSIIKKHLIKESSMTSETTSDFDEDDDFVDAQLDSTHSDEVEEWKDVESDLSLVDFKGHLKNAADTSVSKESKKIKPSFAIGASLKLKRLSATDSEACFAEECELATDPEEVMVLHLKPAVHEPKQASVFDVSDVQETDKKFHRSSDEFTKSSLDKADTIADFSEMSEISDFPTDSNDIQNVTTVSEMFSSQFGQAAETFSRDAFFTNVSSSYLPSEGYEEWEDVEADNSLEELEDGNQFLDFVPQQQFYVNEMEGLELEMLSDYATPYSFYETEMQFENQAPQITDQFPLELNEPIESLGESLIVQVGTLIGDEDITSASFHSDVENISEAMASTRSDTADYSMAKLDSVSTSATEKSYESIQTYEVKELDLPQPLETISFAESPALVTSQSITSSSLSASEIKEEKQSTEVLAMDEVKASASDIVSPATFLCDSSSTIQRDEGTLSLAEKETQNVSQVSKMFQDLKDMQTAIAEDVSEGGGISSEAIIKKIDDELSEQLVQSVPEQRARDDSVTSLTNDDFVDVSSNVIETLESETGSDADENNFIEDLELDAMEEGETTGKGTFSADAEIEKVDSIEEDKLHIIQQQTSLDKDRINVSYPETSVTTASETTIFSSTIIPDEQLDASSFKVSETVDDSIQALCTSIPISQSTPTSESPTTVKDTTENIEISILQPNTETSEILPKEEINELLETKVIQRSIADDHDRCHEINIPETADDFKQDIVIETKTCLLEEEGLINVSQSVHEIEKSISGETTLEVAATKNLTTGTETSTEKSLSTVSNVECIESNTVTESSQSRSDIFYDISSQAALTEELDSQDFESDSSLQDLKDEDSSVKEVTSILPSRLVSDDKELCKQEASNGDLQSVIAETEEIPEPVAEVIELSISEAFAIKVQEEEISERVLKLAEVSHSEILDAELQKAKSEEIISKPVEVLQSEVPDSEAQIDEISEVIPTHIEVSHSETLDLRAQKAVISEDTCKPIEVSYSEILDIEAQTDEVKEAVSKPSDVLQSIILDSEAQITEISEDIPKPIEVTQAEVLDMGMQKAVISEVTSKSVAISLSHISDTVVQKSEVQGDMSESVEVSQSKMTDSTAEEIEMAECLPEHIKILQPEIQNIKSVQEDEILTPVPESVAVLQSEFLEAKSQNIEMVEPTCGAVERLQLEKLDDTERAKTSDATTKCIEQPHLETLDSNLQGDEAVEMVHESVELPLSDVLETWTDDIYDPYDRQESDQRKFSEILTAYDFGHLREDTIEESSHELTDDLYFESKEPHVNENDLESSSLYESWSERSFELDEHVLHYEHESEDDFIGDQLVYDIQDEEEEAILRAVDENLRKFSDHMTLEDDFRTSPDDEFSLELDQTDAHIPPLDSEPYSATPEFGVFDPSLDEYGQYEYEDGGKLESFVSASEGSTTQSKDLFSAEDKEEHTESIDDIYIKDSQNFFTEMTEESYIAKDEYSPSLQIEDEIAETKSLVLGKPLEAAEMGIFIARPVNVIEETSEENIVIGNEINTNKETSDHTEERLITDQRCEDFSEKSEKSILDSSEHLKFDVSSENAPIHVEEAANAQASSEDIALAFTLGSKKQIHELSADESVTIPVQSDVSTPIPVEQATKIQTSSEDTAIAFTLDSKKQIHKLPVDETITIPVQSDVLAPIPVEQTTKMEASLEDTELTCTLNLKEQMHELPADENVTISVRSDVSAPIPVEKAAKIQASPEDTELSFTLGSKKQSHELTADETVTIPVQSDVSAPIHVEEEAKAQAPSEDVELAFTVDLKKQIPELSADESIKSSVYSDVLKREDSKISVEEVKLDKSSLKLSEAKEEVSSRLEISSVKTEVSGTEMTVETPLKSQVIEPSALEEKSLKTNFKEPELIQEVADTKAGRAKEILIEEREAILETSNKDLEVVHKIQSRESIAFPEVLNMSQACETSVVVSEDSRQNEVSSKPEKIEKVAEISAEKVTSKLAHEPEKQSETGKSMVSTEGTSDNNSASFGVKLQDKVVEDSSSFELKLLSESELPSQITEQLSVSIDLQQKEQISEESIMMKEKVQTAESQEEGLMHTLSKQSSKVETSLEEMNEQVVVTATEKSIEVKDMKHVEETRTEVCSALKDETSLKIQKEALNQQTESQLQLESETSEQRPGETEIVSTRDDGEKPPALPRKRPTIQSLPEQEQEQEVEVLPSLPLKTSRHRLSLSDEEKSDAAPLDSQSQLEKEVQEIETPPSLPRKTSRHRLSLSSDQQSDTVASDSQPKLEKEEQVDTPVVVRRRRSSSMKYEESTATSEEASVQPPTRRRRSRQSDVQMHKEPEYEDPDAKMIMPRRVSYDDERTILSRKDKLRVSIEERMSKLQSEGKCLNREKAFIAAKLIEMQFEEKDALMASIQCTTVYHAIKFLTQLCELCNCRFPINLMASMSHCPHKACRECLRAHFTTLIYDRSVFSLLCPICRKPDISDSNIQEYFNHLDMMLRRILRPDVYDLFQRKLRDEVLTKDPNFHWCSQCSNGFIASPRLKKLYCPECSAITCALCHQTWELEHEGIHCERFQQWKDMHTPEPPPAGLVKKLADRGVTCPSCSINYSHACGGCMLYKCAHCNYKFCGFCRKPYLNGVDCKEASTCKDLGLHAHHPYTCLSFLRDIDSKDFQKLLTEAKVPYATIPAPDQIVKTRCQVREQKHLHGTVTEDRCLRDIVPYFAGLCQVHYLEYLAEMLRFHKISPLPVMTTMDLQFILRKSRIFIPEKVKGETLEEYHNQLQQIVISKLSS